MSKTRYLRLSIVALAIGLSVSVAVPGPASAQLSLPLLGGGGTSSSGTSATALAATVLGSTTTLASTGTLANSWDALGAELDSGSIPAGGADVLEATAIGEGDFVSSKASLADLSLATAADTVSADFTMATAAADSYGGTAGWSEVDGLVVDGVPIIPTGDVNQTISLGALRVVLNEVTPAANGITVNALHITTLDGLVDVVVGSATAVAP